MRGDIEDSLAILRAIAGGAHRRADISRLAGLPVRTTDYRLATLVELDILEYRKAVERIRNADRWGAYHLRDPFFRMRYSRVSSAGQEPGFYFFKPEDVLRSR